jgi:hypothetical protein
MFPGFQNMDDEQIKTKTTKKKTPSNFEHLHQFRQENETAIT